MATEFLPRSDIYTESILESGHPQSPLEGLRPSDLGKGASSLATHMGLQRAEALCRG